MSAMYLEACKGHEHRGRDDLLGGVQQVESVQPTHELGVAALGLFARGEGGGGGGVVEVSLRSAVGVTRGSRASGCTEEVNIICLPLHVAKEAGAVEKAI